MSGHFCRSKLFRGYPAIHAGLAASEMTYIVSGGALNSTQPTNHAGLDRFRG